MNKLLITGLLILGSFSSFAKSSIAVSCSTIDYDSAYDFKVSEVGEVTSFRGLYDGEFNNSLLNDGTFTSVRYIKKNELHIIEGMVGPNVSMRLTYNSNLSPYVVNGSAVFLESDQEKIEVICESGAGVYFKTKKR